MGRTGMITWGKDYWPVFLIISSVWVLAGFGIPELIAVFAGVSSHLDNTLSNYSHVELNVSAQMTKHTVAWWASMITWWLFVSVVTAHIWFDLGG